MMRFVVLYLASVFIASVSQVLLKKEAMKEHDTSLKEYLNPMVIVAYSLFLLTTLMTLIAYKEVPLSLGPVLEATSYVYVTLFGVIIFKEKLSRERAVALSLILGGIIVFSLGS